MPRVRRTPTKDQRRAGPAVQHEIALDDSTGTTPVKLAKIQALIPLRLKAVKKALVAGMTALAGGPSMP